MNAADFAHVHQPGTGERTLLMLHGTGGDERDLLPLGRAIDPTANLLSPRGKVLEHGMPRFFRRLAEGVFDLEDLHARTHELALWIAAAKAEYKIGADLTAVGYSNGANIAASLLLAGVAPFQAAVLIRSMVPFEPAQLPDLSGKKVLMLSGIHDPIIPAASGKRLAELLRNSGADIEIVWKETGHGLIQSDIADARQWLRA